MSETSLPPGRVIPRRHSESEPPAEPPTAPPEGGRPGDSYVGTPRQRLGPTTAAITAESVPTLADFHHETTEHETQRPDLTQGMQQFIRRISGTLTACMLLGVALLGLLVLAQAASALNNLWALPWPLALPGLTLLAALLGVVGYFALRLWQVYQALEPNQPLSNEASAADQARMVQTLRQRLEDPKVLFALEGETRTTLERARAQLLEAEPLSQRDWLLRYEREWLQPLDALAAKRIDHHARFVALKVAISPNALLDMLLVFYNGLGLLRDLCRLYQLRPGPLGMLYLLGLVLVQGFLASQMQENMENIEGTARSLFEGEGLLGSGIALGSAGFLGARAFEAAVNYLFMRRIGYTARQLLRPLPTRR